MDFIGIGPAELLVVLVLILIFVGPKRLPEMAAQLARFIRAARRYSARVTAEFQETMGDLEKEYEDMQGEWKEVGQGLDESARAVRDELREADQETKRALDDARSADDGAARTAADEPSARQGDEQAPSS